MTNVPINKIETTISAHVESVHAQDGMRLGYQASARVFRGFEQLYQVSDGAIRDNVADAWAAFYLLDLGPRQLRRRKR